MWPSLRAEVSLGKWWLIEVCTQSLYSLIKPTDRELEQIGNNENPLSIECEGTRHNYLPFISVSFLLVNQERRTELRMWRRLWEDSTVAIKIDGPNERNVGDLVVTQLLCLSYRQ